MHSILVQLPILTSALPTSIAALPLTLIAHVLNSTRNATRLDGGCAREGELRQVHDVDAEGRREGQVSGRAERVD